MNKFKVGDSITVQSTGRHMVSGIFVKNGTKAKILSADDALNTFAVEFPDVDGVRLQNLYTVEIMPMIFTKEEFSNVPPSLMGWYKAVEKYVQVRSR
jgi:hypothetical protein